MYINIQLHKNKDFFSNSGPFFRFCKTKKPGFPGFRARCAAFAVAGNRKRLRRPSNPLSGRTRVFALANSKKNEFCASKSRSMRARKNPLSGRTRAFALANSKKTSFAQAKVAACAHAKIPCPRFLIKIDILDFFAKNNSKIYNKILKTLEISEKSKQPFVLYFPFIRLYNNRYFYNKKISAKSGGI